NVLAAPPGHPYHREDNLALFSAGGTACGGHRLLSTVWSCSLMTMSMVCPSCGAVQEATENPGSAEVRCSRCQASFAPAGPSSAWAAPASSSEPPSTPKTTPTDSDPSRANARAAGQASDRRPRKKPTATRPMPAFALFLIIGGVIGSLAIVGASIFIVI